MKKLIAADRVYMDCSKFIVSEEYFDYIAQNVRVPSNIQCRVKVDENWSVIYGTSSQESDVDVEDLRYRTIPKLYGLMDSEVIREQIADETINDTSAYDSAGITAVLNQPTLDVRGQGILIGIIDTGACVIKMLSVWINCSICAIS